MSYNYPALFVKIEARLSEKPSLSTGDVATELKVHRNTIGKAVYQATGMTFRSYRQKKLLQTALTLLTEEAEQTVKEIAFKLGYQSPKAFSRFIKRVTGRTPSEIRGHKTMTT